MKVYRDVSQFNVAKPILTVGSFDGVHLGHRKVIDRLNEIAASKKGESVIFTFAPHPRVVLSPQQNDLRLLTTLDEKIELLEQAGVDHLIIFPFTKDFSELSYTDFVRSILVTQLGIDSLVVGYDHKFGKNRKGDFEMLKGLAMAFGFELEKLDVLLSDDVNVSSTKIRHALQEGDIARANKYLGYPFRLNGTVVEGQKLGRKIQFPTANIETSDPHKIIPGYGVYAVNVLVEGETYQGMLNIGTRPTINNNADHRSIEVHIFDFDQDIYQKQLELKFLAKVREEQKFGSIDGLRSQLEQDKLDVRHLLKNL
ncbi:bifunctional riboflavin kinase/FAD synthetase [Sunxiuqinia elliptica]|uniref:Riboflavin biosynthesis protein n=1 Tax=Sunxiuqinia elliptica TaxID=655355 RepID=A0A4R6H9E5_9BACT|nr:bifunctional riboflavin kinase/FAD synthetase [Sunxiuqinia elliptica]TDO04952.1 riboflavin kinase/FMN adenylyltransferase [Sunxiuqinia elliptica]TDO64500.1 riboflavin kinase/FMN adenylyltransferase [Sunxiuqinia elliptica]